MRHVQCALLGIADPAEHFKGKKVRATGTVKLHKERPEIAVEDPKQIELVEEK
jgi:DNA/RNA endonuclease YhcR with UshA esterase domain